MNIETVTDKNRFKELKEEWNDLLAKSKSNNFFLTWEWLYTWWSVFGKKNPLYILLYKDSKMKIIGIFPLFVKINNPVLKELRFLGTGEDVPSEYLDIICEPNREEEITLAFMDFIWAKTNVFHLVLFADMNLCSKSINYLENFLKQRRIKYRMHEQRPFCPSINFNGSNNWSEFLLSRSKALRQNVRRWRKNAEEKFKVEFKTYDSLSPNDNLFNKFIELHSIRRRQKNTQSRFSSVDYSDFHKQLIFLISQKSWLHFNVLEFNSNIVAMKYNFKYSNKIYSYQGGWLPKYAKYDVGQLLFSYIVENAINDKIKELDMLRGEEKHKFFWANMTNEKKKIIISKSTQGDIYMDYQKIRKILMNLLKIVLPASIKNNKDILYEWKQRLTKIR